VSWIWPVIGLLMVAAIILVSLRMSSRRSPDLPEMKGEAGGPTRMNIFGTVTNLRKSGRGRGRLGL
jgi:hypothetical protein